MPWDSVDKWRDEDYWPADGDVAESNAPVAPGEVQESRPAVTVRALPVWPALVVWAAFFVCLALNLHG